MAINYKSHPSTRLIKRNSLNKSKLQDTNYSHSRCPSQTILSGSAQSRYCSSHVFSWEGATHSPQLSLGSGFTMKLGPAVSTNSMASTLYTTTQPK